MDIEFQSIVLMVFCDFVVEEGSMTNNPYMYNTKMFSFSNFEFIGVKSVTNQLVDNFTSLFACVTFRLSNRE